MSVVNLQETVHKSIETSIQKSVEEIKAALVKETVARFEKEVKRLVGEAAIDLSHLFTIERSGVDLLIRVKFDHSK